ncbi:MAG: iron-only hydrogenase system regulator [Clostridia bacterium]|nr:iron-only hydrogenase system regulator [Clostridia bacterium]
MANRAAVMAIVVDDTAAVEGLNALLHDYADVIIGRMGIPYKKRGVSILSVAIDAPQDVTAGLAGKLGNLQGVSVKTAYSNVIDDET